MGKLIVDSFLYDVGFNQESADAMVNDVISRTRASWDSGADLVVFPEYLWANLMFYPSPYLTLGELADLFWSKYWSDIEAALGQNGKAVILGSVTVRSGDKLRNRSPMIVSGKTIFQDKLCLTPWETHLEGGSEAFVFEFKGLKITNLICLDSEIPETGHLLKEAGPIDVMVVPSATESLVGVERIARCASARSVELGAAVIVSQLTGGVGDDFIGDNLGQVALYLPSLAATEKVLRVDERGVEISGTKVERFEIDLDVLEAGRKDLVNTDPAKIKAASQVKIKLA